MAFDLPKIGNLEIPEQQRKALEKFAADFFTKSPFWNRSEKNSHKDLKASARESKLDSKANGDSKTDSSTGTKKDAKFESESQKARKTELKDSAKDTLEIPRLTEMGKPTDKATSKKTNTQPIEFSLPKIADTSQKIEDTSKKLDGPKLNTFADATANQDRRSDIKDKTSLAFTAKEHTIPSYQVAKTTKSLNAIISAQSGIPEKTDSLTFKPIQQDQATANYWDHPQPQSSRLLAAADIAKRSDEAVLLSPSVDRSVTQDRALPLSRITDSSLLSFELKSARDFNAPEAGQRIIVPSRPVPIEPISREDSGADKVVIAKHEIRAEEVIRHQPPIEGIVKHEPRPDAMEIRHRIEPVEVLKPTRLADIRVEPVGGTGVEVLRPSASIDIRAVGTPAGSVYTDTPTVIASRTDKPVPTTQSEAIITRDTTATPQAPQAVSQQISPTREVAVAAPSTYSEPQIQRDAHTQVTPTSSTTQYVAASKDEYALLEEAKEKERKRKEKEEEWIRLMTYKSPGNSPAQEEHKPEQAVAQTPPTSRIVDPKQIEPPKPIEPVRVAEQVAQPVQTKPIEPARQTEQIRQSEPVRQQEVAQQVPQFAKGNSNSNESVAASVAAAASIRQLSFAPISFAREADTKSNTADSAIASTAKSVSTAQGTAIPAQTSATSASTNLGSQSQVRDNAAVQPNVVVGAATSIQSVVTGKQSEIHNLPTSNKIEPGKSIEMDGTTRKPLIYFQPDNIKNTRPTIQPIRIVKGGDIVDNKDTKQINHLTGDDFEIIPETKKPNKDDVAFATKVIRIARRRRLRKRKLQELLVKFPVASCPSSESTVPRKLVIVRGTKANSRRTRLSQIIMRKGIKRFLAIEFSTQTPVRTFVVKKHRLHSTHHPSVVLSLCDCRTFISCSNF